MRTCVAAAFIFFSAAVTQAAERQEPPIVALSDAPVNTWVRIAWSPTGGREPPVFVSAANLRCFVMASGMQATGGVVPRHYDTEEFDLTRTKWFNAYPAAVAAQRPESGPVGDEYAQARVKIGHNGPDLFYRDGEFLRLGAGGQWLTTRLGYEWCYVPDNGKIDADGKPLTFKENPFRWHDALAYEPQLKLAVLNSSYLRKVFVLRFDRQTAKLAEAKD